ncbi:DUF3147 family protein [Methyloceanibacter sp.]|uniref:DUF3147 family protein n=1 Tax=Methyloceanibacter sp. TaxID=1965321 RepID=UPI0020839CD4|nr:DUF3147 family protein [Methyloceanibacter sp.]GFO83167.1 MAG: hypothetical protein A49_27940 [Methyloceanibacter sp.]HML91899.1 DUF3147 family protein [Methyloceanibacter sp.]
MLYATIKVLLTSVLVVAVSEAAKRSALFGALIASIPLTSVLAMIWLYVDTGDTEKIARLSTGIFWLVLPSLVLFISLPILLRGGLDFYVSLAASIALTVGAYFVMLYVLGAAGIEV